MTDKMLTLFKAHVKAQHGATLYPYQTEIARNVFDALIKNLRLTSNSTPEDIKKLKIEEQAIEISRQAGKTSIIVWVVEFILEFFTKAFDRPIRVGLTAPQDKQTKIDFDRLKFALRKTQQLIVSDLETDRLAKEESNAHNLVLPTGASVAVFSMNAISKIEGQTFDIIIVEEAQDANDKIMIQSVFPMGATTNAPRIMIGTAGTQICYFYRLVQSGHALIYRYRDVIAQRRMAYEEDGNALHLVYEQYVLSEREKFGEDSDEFRRPYNLEWLIGTGNFTTEEELDALYGDYRCHYQQKEFECFAGIDTAKNPDSTVVTVLRYNTKLRKKELLNWCELRGDNYQDQFDIITHFLGQYNVVAIAIDSTGQGDFMPDMFERHTEWADEKSGLYRIKFSLVSKDLIYKNLKVSIKELLTSLPKIDKKGEKFRQQMLDLQQEYKGQLLSVHHPDDPNAHDDYPDSWALAEWAYAKWNEENGLSVGVITTEKERKVAKNDEGETTDYWPGSDW